MKRALLASIFLVQLNANAFLKKSVFPKEIQNECDYSWTKNSWNKNSKDFLVGRFNVLIELKSASGELEDRSYVYINCAGFSQKIKPRPYYDFANTTTSCIGLRVNALDSSKLEALNIDPIRPENVEIKSSPTDNKLVLVWENHSTFEIENKKNFAWSMKSKLSGNTSKGFVSCQ